MTTNHKPIAFLLSSLLMTGFAFAQDGNAKKEKQIRLKIVQTENGKTTKIDTTFSDEASLDAFMKQNKLDVPEPPSPPDAPEAPEPPAPPTPPTPFTDEGIEISGNFFSEKDKVELKKEMRKIKRELSKSIDELKEIKLDIRIEDVKDKKGKCIIIKDFKNGKDSFCYHFSMPDCEKLKEEMKELDELKSFHFNFDFNDDDEKGNVKKKSKVIIIEKEGDEKSTLPQIEITKPAEPAKPTEEKKAAPKEASAGFQLQPKLFSLSPNPGNGFYNLKFALDSTEPVSVKVVDLSGDVVFNDEISNFSGQYEKDLKIEGRSRGSYLLQIQQGGQWMHKKFLLQ